MRVAFLRRQNDRGALIVDGPGRITQSETHIAAVAQRSCILWSLLQKAVPEGQRLHKIPLTACRQRLLIKPLQIEGLHWQGQHQTHQQDEKPIHAASAR